VAHAPPATAHSSRNKDAIVVGGGDTAMEEATFLTRFVNKGHGRASPRHAAASKIMQDRARKESEDRVSSWDSPSMKSSAGRKKASAPSR